MDAAPRTRAALAELEAATAFITPGEHVTSLTEEFLRQLVNAALAGKRLERALREDRLLERLEAAGAFVAAFRTFDEARYYDYKGASYYAAREALDRALAAWNVSGSSRACVGIPMVVGNGGR